jgi:hypothetical protein
VPVVHVVPPARLAHARVPEHVFYRNLRSGQQGFGDRLIG